jgi:Zn-dependent peptidase ImmA (M78 family)
MISDAELSPFAIVADALGMMFNPGVEALKLQRDFDVESVEDIPLAAERAGCKISYVDLPVNASGFAKVIEGKAHIVVNRAKPSRHNKFTIAHELGHHVLHINPRHDGGQASLLTNNMAEYEANMYATMQVGTVTHGEEQEEMLTHNPEMRSTLAISIFVTLAAILIALIFWVCSRLFQRHLSASIETR